MPSAMDRIEALSLLGRLRPLRGARPAAGAAARRLRAADGRRAAQAALVGARPARAARRRRLAVTLTATAPARWSRRGRRSDDDGHVGVLVWNGTLDQSKAERPDPLRRDGRGRARRAGRRGDVQAGRRAGRRRPLQHRDDLGSATSRRRQDWPDDDSGRRCGRPTGSRSSPRARSFRRRQREQFTSKPSLSMPSFALFSPGRAASSTSRRCG